MGATNTNSIRTELVADFGRRIRSICCISIGLSRILHKLQLQRTGFSSCGQIRRPLNSTGEPTTRDVNRQMSALLFLGSSGHLSCEGHMRAKQHLTQSVRFGISDPRPAPFQIHNAVEDLFICHVIFCVSFFPLSPVFLRFYLLSEENPSIYDCNLTHKYS